MFVGASDSIMLLCSLLVCQLMHVCVLAFRTEVEQPGSSVLWKTPYYQHLLFNCGPSFFHRTFMGLYNHWSPKPTMLFGNSPGSKLLHCTHSWNTKRNVLPDECQCIPKLTNSCVLPAAPRPMVTEFGSSLPKDKRKDLQKLAKGRAMVTKTKCKKDPKRTWVILGKKWLAA